MKEPWKEPWNWLFSYSKVAFKSEYFVNFTLGNRAEELAFYI